MVQYKFWYCERHDDGFLIETNSKIVPPWHKMCHSSQCDYSWWSPMGTIEYRDNIIEEKEYVYEPSYYDRFNGGFKFIFYASSIQNIFGSITFNNTHPLMQWFQNKCGEGNNDVPVECYGCQQGYENQMGHACMGF
jgi:hypothetical protein